MSTTSLSSTLSSYNVGAQQGHFDLMSSTATSGTVARGYGEGHVERGGSLIKSVYGPLRFGWIGQNGDVVHAKFVDNAGNAGSFVTYTYTVTSSYAFVQYVDATGGSNSNDGESSGAAVQTLDQAETNLNAYSLTAGDEVAIYLKAGETFTQTTSWLGASSTAHRVSVLVYDSGARPIVNMSASQVVFTEGLARAYRVDGIDFNGSGSGSAVWSAGRSTLGAGTREPLDVMVQNCDLDGFDYGLIHEDDTAGADDRTTLDHADFMALDNVSMDNILQYGIYAPAAPRYVLWRDVDIATAGQNPIRVWSLADAYVEGGTITSTNNCRFIAGADSNSEDRMHDVDFYDWTINGATTQAVRLEMDQTADSYFRQIRFFGCAFKTNGINTSVNQYSSTLGVDLVELQVVNCWGWGVNLGVSNNTASATKIRSVWIRGCTFIENAYAGGALVQVGQFGGANEQNIVDGSLLIEGCLGSFEIDGSSETMAFLQVWASAADKVASGCDYNHVTKQDATTIRYEMGYSTIAAWRTASSTDANSSVTSSSSPPYTNTTSSTLDLSLTADSGAGSGTGIPATYALDSLGFLRDATTPDAGAFEYGASTRPDSPDLTPVVVAVATPRTPPGSAPRSGGHPATAARAKGIISRFGKPGKADTRPNRMPGSVAKSMAKRSARPNRVPKAMRARGYGKR